MQIYNTKFKRTLEHSQEQSQTGQEKIVKKKPKNKTNKTKYN